MEISQTILVLGGGRFPDGSLTNLSKQRLAAAVDLFRKGRAPTITVLGGTPSTYLPNAIKYAVSGAKTRAQYLVEQGVPEASIHEINDGKDTIGEAIACRTYFPALELSSFVLVTSELHMPRALWLFKTIMGNNYNITPANVPCGGLLIEEEEKEYLKATQEYFLSNKPLFDNLSSWHSTHQTLYDEFKTIHDRFHPKGRESEAYLAVHAAGNHS